MRTLLLTGDGLRHRYTAASLAAQTELVGVVSETKAPLVAAPAELAREDHLVLSRHLAQRDSVEAELLGAAPLWGTKVLHVPRGGVNTDDVSEWIATRRPDVIVLFGTGLVRDPLLRAWEGRMVNLHLGLSPYYRGSATNFWPLVLCQPECVGATIHLATREVDAGNILAQVRPEARPEDGAHELGTKALMAAVKQLPGTLKGFLAGTGASTVQDLSIGRVFRRRDFNADAVRRLWQNLEAGMIPEYLRHAEARRAAYPIVEVAA
jgi:folate-dependent phosphoribosylglycinamide formyltransferase PurN